jgi:pimeloyl-ACP methyl ester carboxylesterase
MPPKRFLSFLFIPLLLLLINLVGSKVLATSNFVKYPGNPIFSRQAGSWDSSHVANPNVLKSSNQYKMWYSGNNGSPWKIGYSYSTNGIDEWVRTNQPVIDVGSLDGWEWGTESPTVIFNEGLNKFQMWYSSVKVSWVSGVDRYRLRYAESSDGIDWNEGNWVLYGTSGKWDVGGPNRGTTVLLINGTYHMWYAGTNEGFSWRIGYATSPDGINWTKQNGGNPVITPTESWELSNVSFPTVLYEDGIYKMWYAAGSSDAPTQIVYAYSTNGINWTKPAEDNPVITRTAGSFDSQYLTVTGILREPDEYRLYYSGLNGTNWAIGLATAPAESTAVPTAKVVIVPGLAASWNQDAILNCKDEGYSGDWTLAPFYVDKVYNPLFESFEGTGLSVIPYYYDWRRQVTSHAASLADFINNLTVESENVHLVGHSMGGLVSRAYLEEQGNNNKVEKLLTVGSPHEGSALSYGAWSGGEIWNGNLIQKILMTLAVNQCNTPLSANDRVSIQSHFPSIQNLLPITDYLRDSSTGAFKPVAAMEAKNNWLPTSFDPPFFGVTLGTLSGRGKGTLETIEVRDRTRHDERLGNWIDGKPIRRLETTEGDGTVLVSSSQIPGADNRIIEKDHAGIVSSAEGIAQIHDFLGIANPSATVSTFEEPTSAFVAIVNHGIFWVESPDGEVRQGKEGVAAFFNPKKGIYKLRIVPTALETPVLVGQFLPNGNYSWKEYKYKNIMPKFSTIHFNPDTILENPLE